MKNISSMKKEELIALLTSAITECPEWAAAHGLYTEGASQEKPAEKPAATKVTGTDAVTAALRGELETFMEALTEGDCKRLAGQLKGSRQPGEAWRDVVARRALARAGRGDVFRNTASTFESRYGV